MLVNIIKLEDGTYTVDKDRRGEPGVDVQISEKAFRRLRRADFAFDMDAMASVEFAYAVGMGQKLRPKLEHEIAAEVELNKPVVAPERPPWRVEGQTFVDDPTIHHRHPKKHRPRHGIPVQPSGDRAHSSWNVERYKTTVAEEKGNTPFWNEDTNGLIKHLNRIKPGHLTNDKHLAMAGDLMSPVRWLLVAGMVVNNRVRWAGRLPDKPTPAQCHKAYAEAEEVWMLTMEATIEILELYEERNGKPWLVTAFK